MRMIRNWLPWLLALLVMALSLAAVFTIEQFQRDRMRSDARNHVADELAQLRARLESTISANLLAVHGLTAVIAAQPDIDQTGFARIARGLFGVDSPLRNVAAAPDMVISMMYPMQGNEAAIGLDYRTHPSQREAAMAVVERGTSVVAGPLPLVQGGVGLVARQPVFLDEAPGAGERRLWGLVSAVIDVERLYEIAGVKAAIRSAGLELALRGRDGKGPQGELFFGDPQVFDAEPVVLNISLPGGGSWQAAAVPSQGWRSHVQSGEIDATRLIGLLLTLMVSALTYFVARGTLKLRATSEELRDSQALFAGFMENLPAGAFIKNARDNRILFENRWLQDHRSSVTHGCGVKDRNDLEVLRAGPRMTQQQMQGADGVTLHCDTLHFLLNDDPSMPLVGGVVMDVTERMAAERDLAANRARLRTLIDTIPDLIWLKDPDGVYLACNHEFERFFGALEAEVMGRRDADFVARELARSFRQHDLAAMAAGRPTTNEEEVVYASDGRKVLLETTKTPVFDDQNRLIGVLGIAHDITARRAAEQALRRNAERLENAEKLAHVGNWEYDIAEKRLSWSDGAYRIFGLEPQTRPVDIDWILEHVHPNDRQRYRDRLAAMLDSTPGFEPTPFRYRIRRPSGAESWLVERARVEYAHEGKPLLVFATVQDVTERELLHREVEERLAELTRWQDVVLGREERIHELKREVNALLRQQGEVIRYASQGEAP